MYRINEENLDGSEFKLTIKYNGKFAGHLLYQLFVFDSKTAIISDLAVVATLRRKGIATELLETAVERIFSRPWMKNVMLQDGSENKITGRIVKKLGFQKDKIGWNIWRLSKNGG